MTKKNSLKIILALLLVVGVGSTSLLFSKKHIQFKDTNNAVSQIDGYNQAIKMQSVFRKIAKTVMPSVVSIQVESEVEYRNPFADFNNDPFFRRFFGYEDGNPQSHNFKQKLQAQGSGFIITKDGYIFSNNHVVKGATKIVVVLSDNRKFKARVVGTDPETDIAILKIDAKNLPVAALGDSSKVKAGDWAIAIGNPFGLANTLTVGFVSFVGRPGMSGYQEFIQTDTAVNPGNSGGPLVNIKGQVTGINTAISTKTGGYMGISFAVPINTAKDIANQLINSGKVVRGYLGIYPQDIDTTTRKVIKLPEKQGVMVAKVVKGSPAEKSGIQQGDIILSLNNIPINSASSLQSKVGSYPPKTKLSIVVLRNKNKKTIVVKLAQRPSAVQETETPDNSTVETVKFLDTEFATASKQELEKNGIGFGVTIAKMNSNSPLASVIHPGEILIGINRVRIRNTADLKNFVQAHGKEKAYTFQIVKNGFMFYRGFEK